MSRRPNFLIFLSDQHRPDHTGFGGNELLRTPNLDAIAARGMRFERAIVANPICMPNRASLVTGRLPSLHGTRYNGISLDWSANTFMRVLRQRGYHAAYFGKSHLQNMAENKHVRDAIFKDAPEQNASIPPYPTGWDDWENADRHREEQIEIPPDFYGLDEADLTVMHGDSCSGHYYQWLLEQGVDPGALQGRANALPFESTTQQVWRTALPEELYPTRYVSHRAVDYLERRKSQPDVPFVAFCSYPDPHHPFTPPGRYFDMYDPREVSLPMSFGDPHTDSLKHYRARRAHPGEQVAFMAPFAPTEAQYRQMAAAEYGAISMIDDGVGEVMDSLDRSGLADDTIVIFTSDHGEMFGDHGMMLKASMHYEGCLRVPLVIASPGREPGACDALVSTLDIAQTVLELADCPEYEGMQGNSLVSLLEKPEGSLRDHVLVEEDQMFDLALLGQPLRMRTLVTQEARVTLYRGSEEGELYDLQSDRAEMNNLFSSRQSRALRAHMLERLARCQMEYADSSPVPGYMA